MPGAEEEERDIRCDEKALANYKAQPCSWYVAAKRSTESALQFDIGMTADGHGVLDFQGQRGPETAQI